MDHAPLRPPLSRLRSTHWTGQLREARQLPAFASQHARHDLVRRDVAEVQIGHAVRHGAAVVNGKREVVAGIVLLLRGGNAREVVEAVRYAAAGSNVIHREADQLHAKGIVSDAIALVGSMNFTHNGIDRLTEMLVFHTDQKRVAEIRLEFDREYGGLS